MKPSPTVSMRPYQQFDMEDPVTAGAAVGMDLDDSDHLGDLLGDLDRPPLDADFFNSFEDDFDDADIA